MRTQRDVLALSAGLLLVGSLIGFTGATALFHNSASSSPAGTSPTGSIAISPMPSVVKTAPAAPTATPALVFVPSDYHFGLTNSLIVGRTNALAVALPDGSVLVAGGSIYNSSSRDITLSSAEIYTAIGAFSQTGSLRTPRSGATATTLADGRILVIGGEQALNASPWHRNLSSAEIYDPATGKFTSTGSMHTARLDATASTLANGDVLVFGGRDDNDLDTRSAEIYHPASGSFSIVGDSLVYPGSSVLLRSGLVFSTGFTDAGGGTESAELYDPANGSFRLAPVGPIAQYGVKLALLPDGRVLLVAENYPGDGCPNAGLAQVYDPLSGTYRLTGPMSAPGRFGQVVSLPSGRILFVSGEIDAPGGGPGPLPVWNKNAMVYDPATNSFANLPDLAADHHDGIAVVRANGVALIAGGGDDDSGDLNAPFAELLWGDQPQP